MNKEIFITIGVQEDAGIYEEGYAIRITLEQLIECRRIIGLEYVTKILSMYYGLKDEGEPVRPTTTQEDA